MNADQGKCTAALYIDIRRAFDTANHTCTIKKLPDFGIRNTELDWLTDNLFIGGSKSRLKGMCQLLNPYHIISYHIISHHHIIII